MALIKELIKSETDGTLSFGDYSLAEKTKKDGFEFQGDLYKVKTFKERKTECLYTNLCRELPLRISKSLKM